MIVHVSALPAMNGDGEIVARADRHEVRCEFPGSWPGVGRCDSCGRIVVRGVGRWWDGWWPR